MSPINMSRGAGSAKGYGLLYPTPEVSAVTVTGGTVTSFGGYTVHTFTANGTLSISGGSKTVDIFIVGGGGGGGGLTSFNGGGAGQASTYTSQSISSGSYPVTIGGGGAVAANGTASSISTFTATYGETSSSANPNKGGTSGNGFLGGTASFSFPLDEGGGGGGSTSAGSGTSGGGSTSSSYRSTNEIFAGGGAGFVYDNEFGEDVGLGTHGGGNSANHGGGGNGGSPLTPETTGNSGIVIVRYLA